MEIEVECLRRLDNKKEDRSGGAPRFKMKLCLVCDVTEVIRNQIWRQHR